MASNNESNGNKNEKSFSDSVKNGIGNAIGMSIGFGLMAGLGGLILTGNPFIAYECAKTVALKTATASALG